MHSSRITLLFLPLTIACISGEPLLNGRRYFPRGPERSLRGGDFRITLIRMEESNTYFRGEKFRTEKKSKEHRRARRLHLLLHVKNSSRKLSYFKFYDGRQGNSYLANRFRGNKELRDSLRALAGKGAEDGLKIDLRYTGGRLSLGEHSPYLHGGSFRANCAYYLQPADRYGKLKTNWLLAPGQARVATIFCEIPFSAHPIRISYGKGRLELRGPVYRQELRKFLKTREAP